MAHKNPEPADELLRLFTKDGIEVEPHTRQWIWDHPEYEEFYAVGSIWIVNPQGQILCGKRSEQLKSAPGKWAPLFGGKVPVGSTCRETAIRELEEEVGIRPDPQKLFPVDDTVIRGRYIYPFDGDVEDVHFNDGEITAVRWMTLDECLEEQRTSPDDWINLFKPYQEAAMRDWIKEHCKN